MERRRRARALGWGSHLLVTAGLVAAAALAACAPAPRPVAPEIHVAAPELPIEIDALYRVSRPGFPPPTDIGDVATSTDSRGLLPGDGGQPLAQLAPISRSPYDCGGLQPVAATMLHPANGAVADLVAAVHPENPAPLQPSAELEQALVRVASLDPERLVPFERIVLQNTALSAAVRLPADAPLALAARGEVRRLALSAESLDALGAIPSRALERWIGPLSTLTDRKGEACGDGRLLLHDRIFHGTRAFRPVRVGGALVLFSQLVALDGQGRAHVTPVIGQIEMRRGVAPGAPVCIVEIAPDALATGLPGGLRAIEYDELSTTPFVRPHGEGSLGCISCHNGHGIGDFADVPSADAMSLLSNRRTAVLGFAADWTAALFKGGS